MKSFIIGPADVAIVWAVLTVQVTYFNSQTRFLRAKSGPGNSSYESSARTSRSHSMRWRLVDESYERLGVRASLAMGSRPLAKRCAKTRKSSEHSA
jgi:hypothetical protein